MCWPIDDDQRSCNLLNKWIMIVLCNQLKSIFLLFLLNEGQKKSGATSKNDAG